MLIAEGRPAPITAPKDSVFNPWLADSLKALAEGKRKTFYHYVFFSKARKMEQVEKDNSKAATSGANKQMGNTNRRDQAQGK